MKNNCQRPNRYGQGDIERENAPSTEDSSQGETVPMHRGSLQLLRKQKNATGAATASTKDTDAATAFTSDFTFRAPENLELGVSLSWKEIWYI